MQLHAAIEQIVDHYPKNRLKALLIWMTGGGAEGVPRQAETLRAILEEDEDGMDVVQCYEMLSHLKLEELVAFSLVNEFGPKFAERPGFGALVLWVKQRLLSKP
jgi:hypothetical protein